jgi:DNA polymerase-3 subunit beta
MQFEIGQPEFKAALDKLVGVLETRTTIPVLSHIKCTATKDSLQLQTTDFEAHLSIIVPAKVKKTGVMLFPGKKTREIVTKLSAGTVTMKLAENQWAHLSCGGAKYKLAGLDASNYPTSPEVLAAQTTVPGTALIQAISMTKFAASEQTDRYSLAVILFSTGQSVATDGHRLAIFRHPDFKMPAEAKEILVPSSGANLLLSLVKDEDTVGIAVTESTLNFSTPDWNLNLRRSTGTFPNYKGVMPSMDNLPFHARINPAVIASVIERVGATADQTTSAMKFTFTAGKLQMQCSSSLIGEGEESLDVESNGDLLVGLNFRYALDYLKRVEGEVALHGKDGQSALLLESGASSYVIMPMRV